MGPVGKIRKPIAVLLFSIITVGIYNLYWTYQVFRELKEHTGQGVGGPIGLVIGLVIGVVNLFLLPAEIGNMYAAEGQPKPMTGLLGLWNLLPLIGTIIWFFKVQGALNSHWASHGAVA